MFSFIVYVHFLAEVGTLFSQCGTKGIHILFLLQRNAEKIDDML